MAKPATNELHLSRLYDAPVKVVWDAWTDPNQAAKWWGPRGFTITTHSKELKVGGVWHYTMHGPDGVDYPNKTLYHVVEKYSKLVYDHGGYDERKPLFTVTVTFKDVKGKTQMDMTMSFESVEKAIEIGKFIKQASGNSTWDRLAEYLGNKGEFVINRSFDVSIEKLYDMWTNPEHLSKWLPPTGFSATFYEADFKVGGSSFYKMTNGTVTMFGRATYLELDRPNKIVYTQVFCDEKGNISKHPGAPVWPETMKNTITLVAEGPEQTRVTVTSEAVGKVSQEEMDMFISARGGMTMGWTGSFDKLEEYLVQAL